jgi:hypothetical protein
MNAVPQAELLIDTARAAAGMGLRSAATAPRQLVYRHAGYEVDLLLQGAGPGGAVLWGQVLSATGAACQGAEVEVTLFRGSVSGEPPSDAVRTVCDAFGEFRLTLAGTAADAALSVAVDGDAFVCWLPPVGESLA